MKPLVSIIFTSYNHKEFLKQALESIVNQTYTNLELIIVDDCSTDGSQEIIKQYSSLPFVKLHLLEKNSGSYVKASNYGAKFAEGEYLLFAQCDDYAEVNQLSRLVDSINTVNNTGVAFSRSNLVDEKGVFISDDYSIRHRSFKDKCSGDVVIEGKEMRNFLSYACVIPNLSAALIRKKLFFDAGSLPEKYIVAADWAFWLELSEKTNFSYISTPLNNFRQHATTIRSSIKIEKQLSEILTLFTDHITKFGLSKAEKKGMLSGVGYIWASYFLEAPSPVLRSFTGFIGKVKNADRDALASFFKGIVSKGVSLFRNKF